MEKGPAQLAHYNTEGILCPECQSILKYELNTYANLGAYICENCGCKRPELNAVKYLYQIEGQVFQGVYFHVQDDSK